MTLLEFHEVLVATKTHDDGSMTEVRISVAYFDPLADFDLDFGEPVDKDRSRARRRYITKNRHCKHGHYRESRDRPCVNPVEWNRRMRLWRYLETVDSLHQMAEYESALAQARWEADQQQREIDAVVRELERQYAHEYYYDHEGILRTPEGHQTYRRMAGLT